MSSFTSSITFSIITPGCGCVDFAVPDSTYKRWHNTHCNWHCPTCGASRHFVAQSEAEKARAERDQARIELATVRTYADELRDQRDQEKRRAISYRGHLSRTKKRIAQGVCPCCQRTFAQLSRHMKAKHPDYAQEIAAAKK